MIKNNKEIYKIGKTNSELFNEADNFKAKNIILPFVYGLPLISDNQEMAVISTNGYQENLNHFKKILISKIKISAWTYLPFFNSIGIIAQNKIDMQNKPEEVISNKNTILSYIIHSYNKINVYKESAIVYDQRNRLFRITLRSSKD